MRGIWFWWLKIKTWILILFVDLIKKLVIETSIQDTIAVLENPPGKKSKEELVFMSEKYLKMDEHVKELIKLVVSESIETSIFYMLCILDGVKKSERTVN